MRGSRLQGFDGADGFRIGFGRQTFLKPDVRRHHRDKKGLLPALKHTKNTLEAH